MTLHMSIVFIVKLKLMTNRPTARINSNTPIDFNVKTFTTFIISILAIFFGFYQLVFSPRIDQLDLRIESISKDQSMIYKELGKINLSINEIKVVNKLQGNMKYDWETSLDGLSSTQTQSRSTYKYFDATKSLIGVITDSIQ